MAPYVKVSSSRFEVDLQQSHFSILSSTSSRLRHVKPTPLDLRSSSRPKSTYLGRLPGLRLLAVSRERCVFHVDGVWTSTTTRRGDQAHVVACGQREVGQNPDFLVDVING